MENGEAHRRAVSQDHEQSQRSLDGELLLLIAKQVSRTWPQLVAVTALMALLLSQYLAIWVPLIWFVVVNVAGYAHLRLLQRLRDDQTRADAEKLKIVARSFTLQGLLRASLPLLFPWLPISICAIVSIYILGLCAAVLGAASGYQRIFRPYCVVAIAPMVLAWLLGANIEVAVGERLIFAGLLLTFAITMLGHAKGVYANFVSAHQMRHERLQLNQQLQEALKHAESASRAKTHFLASASHDLRQPMHALALFSGSLLLRPLDTRTAVIAEQIDQAITVLSSQLDALLDISRLDAGVVDKNLSVIDLHTMLSLLLQEFRAQADQKHLSLVLRCDEGVLVKSDAGLLLRVLRNLISNAVKYTHRGGITVTVETIAERCKLVVRDTGSGIPIAEQDRVFEEFYQLDNPERDRSKGLGLGLAIVRRLTALLEIELQLDSQVGEGSQFTLWLPRTSDHAPLPPPLPAAQRLPQLRVLVVDDEEAIRLGMQTLLEELGFEVRLASSTDAALALAALFSPAIVLADFRLHGEDNGMHTIASLRRRWPDLPALLISGDTAPDRLQKAHAAGIDLLHKPVTAALLKASILKAVAPT